MKSYTVAEALAALSPFIDAEGKIIHVEKNVGIGNWGKLDFLKKNGYTVITK